MTSKGGMRVVPYFTQRGSPHWPNLSVYYHKGGKYVVSDYYSEAARRRIEGILNGEA